MGLDPSFSSMGIALIDTELKLIEFKRIEGSMGKVYQEIFYESLDRCNKLKQVIQDFNPSVIHTEEPLPQAQSSSGLFMLDSMLFYTMILIKVPEIWNSHPTHLRHLHGGKYTKTDSVNLAKKFMGIFMEEGYEFSKTRINNDEAEAFIYSCRMYVAKHDDKIKNELIKICPNIKNKKEKQLYPKNK